MQIIQIISVFLIAMAPIGELRFSIPYGMHGTNLDLMTVIVLSIIGNILSGIIIIYVLPYIIPSITKVNFIDRLYKTIIKRTYSNSKIIEKRKYYGLIIFISIPSPFTGVWTGALASNLLGMSKKKSIFAICIGVLIASVLVTLLSSLGYLTYDSA